MTTSATSVEHGNDTVEQTKLTADSDEQAITASSGIAVPHAEDSKQSTAPAHQQGDILDPPASPTGAPLQEAAPSSADSNLSTIAADLSEKKTPTEDSITVPHVVEDTAKPTLGVETLAISSTEPTRPKNMPSGPEPKTPRRPEGLSSFEFPLDGDSERKSGWRPVKRHATTTFTGTQISDHASLTTRAAQIGNVPHSARPGTEMEKTLFAGTLDRRERELDRRERELDRRERELERMERELERRRRELEQDRARWETQTQMESYMHAVAQPQINRTQEAFPTHWQTALDSFKKSLQAQILLERQEAEIALESRIMRRVNEELAKERKMQEVMQMSEKEVNELMEDTVGHWLRKDEDIADNIRFQSLLHLAQEKMAALAGIQLLPDTDSWALSWRLAIGPSFITQERYNKAMDLLKDKELDASAKAVVESKAAMEFIVEWTSHLRKDESFTPGRISRDEYLESVRRQVEKLHLDEHAFLSLVDFVVPQ
ncbi:hypothetical protein CVT24_003076 [Panaeolus cyanescens]|uniref:Uncharacterized protein n=1 Tax=Panaeolus cyanescens TaxID=181874 RepID=A0A409VU33_9AGAR|nr:hypothetical protein CVT24_003076 [Panaeolus cyanescens]